MLCIHMPQDFKWNSPTACLSDVSLAPPTLMDFELPEHLFCSCVLLWGCCPRLPAVALPSDSHIIDRLCWALFSFQLWLGTHMFHFRCYKYQQNSLLLTRAWRQLEIISSRDISNTWQMTANLCSIKSMLFALWLKKQTDAKWRNISLH